METICSIATPNGNGAISIIRVSGDYAISNVNKIFKGKNLINVESHTIHYGHIYDEEVIDEVLVSVMRAPKTYTKEDVVEINCHGGVFVTNRVLEALLKNGCRLANPGEFTFRAFINGRIDLTKAEAVMDMINAKSSKALKVANQALSGKMYNLIVNLRDEIVNLIAKVEVNIDYPEYDDAIVMSNEILKPNIEKIINRINKILEKSKTGKIFREGDKTVIIGKPNVGKSSLLNNLLDEDKAIVTDIEGTTRDLVEGYIELAGITLNLIDTAGIRETNDVVEKIGVNKSIKAIESAELALVLLDSSNKLTNYDKYLLDLTKDKKRIVIGNKSDLEKNIDYECDVYISVKNNNIEQLEKKIIEVLDISSITDDLDYLTNTRHIAKLSEVKKSLYDSLESIENEMPVDMVEIDLKNSWLLLGSIIGDDTNDSLLDELFSNFCLGK